MVFVNGKENIGFKVVDVTVEEAVAGDDEGIVKGL